MTAYIHEMLGLIAVSLRMMNYKTLEVPIKGPRRPWAVTANTETYVTTEPIGHRGPSSGMVATTLVWGCRTTSSSTNTG